MKVAAVLVVRDEADDISWWVAHHAGLGFSALMIYDNASTDGTWTLLQAARLVADVRPHRCDEVLLPDELRAFALENAVFRYGSEFDWIGVFDIRDYLTPEPGVVLADMLPSPEGEADAVMFSTRIHGGNAYVGIPPVSPVRAYPKHAPKDFPLHEQGILCVRPSLVRENGAGRYVGGRPDGELILTPDGAVAVPRNAGWEPEWSRACIRKYAVRSMMHRVRALERQPGSDLRDEAWFALDRNDIDGGAGADSFVTEQLAGSIYGAVWAGLVRHREFERALSSPEGGASEFGSGERPRVFRVLGSSGLVLCYDRQGHTLVGVKADDVVSGGRYCRVLACIWESVPGWVVMVREDAGADLSACLYSEFMGVPQAFLPFEMQDAGEGRVSFWSASLRRFLTIIENDGSVGCNRPEVRDWERFRVEAVDSDDLAWSGGCIGLLPAVVREGLTARTFARLPGALEMAQAGMLPLIFAMLPAEEQRVVLREYPGVFPCGMMLIRE